MTVNGDSAGGGGQPGSEIRYNAAASYVPVHSDEIQLSLGDTVVILHAYDDGLLPRNFLVEQGTSGSSSGGGIGGSSLGVDGASLHSVGEAMQAVERSSSLIHRTRTTSSDGTNVSEIIAEAMAATRVLAATVNGSSSSAGSAGGAGSAAVNGTEDGKRDPQKKLAAITARRAGRARIPANIGSLKIAVIGDSGIGKTAFIQNFFSISEVVDADSVNPADGSTKGIRELRASTIPLADVHTGEERFNLNFVDTPGFGQHLDAMVTIKPVTEYAINQFLRTDRVFVKNVVIPNLVKFLNSGTGAHTHVDIAIYAILHRLKPVDLEYMRSLAPYVNIVPVIVKSDTLRPSELFALKCSVLEELSKAGIHIYGFGLTTDELLELAKARVPGAPPFAVSSTKAAPKSAVKEGAEIINEFETLKNNLLYNHINDLRQLTAEKFVNWRSKAR
ncbi:hypothetical protein HK102_002410 [Quaeritorhiza haematococci]|nr:hypothetical protein HK102_002410 [Quaeritorhiza haematococci]